MNWISLALALTEIWHLGKCQQQVEVTEHPKNKILKFGASTSLSCEFNANVDCIWYRNGIIFSSPPRVIWTSNKSEEYMATTCNIEIKKFTTTDTGKWKCGKTEDDSGKILFSKEAWLLEHRKPVIYLNGQEIQEVDQILANTETDLTCASDHKNVPQTLHWELDDKIIGHTSNEVLRWNSSMPLKIQSNNQKSNLNCVVSLPSFQGSPETASLHLICDKKDDISTDPIITWNGKQVWKIDASQLNEDIDNIGLMCSKSGNLDMQFHWELDGKTVCGSVDYMTTSNGCRYVTLAWNSTVDWRISTDRPQFFIRCIAKHQTKNQTRWANLSIENDSMPMKLEVIIAISSGCAGIIIILSLALFCLFRKKKSVAKKDESDIPLYANASILGMQVVHEIPREPHYINIMEAPDADAGTLVTNNVQTLHQSPEHNMSPNNVQSDKKNDPYYLRYSHVVPSAKHHQHKIVNEMRQLFTNHQGDKETEGYLIPISGQQRAPANIRPMKEEHTYINLSRH